MTRIAKSLLVGGLSALLSTEARAQHPLAHATLPGKNIWRSGRNSVWEVPCVDHPDADDTSVTVEARTGGRARRSHGCYPSPSFVSVIWTGEPGLGGPDVMLLGQSGGSAGCGDVVAITFDEIPTLRALAACPAEEVPIVIMGDVPTFDANLSLVINGSSGADVRAGRIAVGAYRDGFKPNLTMMTAEPLTADERAQTLSMMVKYLHRWAMSLSDGAQGLSTPDTVEALLNLVLSGRADQARALLFEAGQTGAGPGFRADAFWDDFSLALVSDPLWKQFHLERLRSAELVVRSASLGVSGQSGRDYLPLSATRKNTKSRSR
jgi:hypothetical protein